MSKNKIGRQGIFAATLLAALSVTGCTGTGTDTSTTPGPTSSISTPTQDQSGMADLKVAVQAVLGPNDHGLAAVGNNRQTGFTNTPLLAGAPDVVRLIVACDGNGEATLQAGSDQVVVACDSKAHIIEKVESSSLKISVPALPANTGNIYVAVAKQ